MLSTPKEWLKDIWLAQKIGSDLDEYGVEIAKYLTPKQYKVNHQPVRANSDMQMYGTRALQVQRAIVDRQIFKDVFHEFDLVYLDGASPNKKPNWDKDTVGNTEPKNGYWANYRVSAVREQNLAIAVYFERLDSR